MPRGDGTGPMGQGPMTGRVMGYCTGYGFPGYTNYVAGRGLAGRFARRGCGFRNMYYATGLPGWQRAAAGMPAFGRWPNANMQAVQPTSEQEAGMLKEEIKAVEAERTALAKETEELKKRLSELEKK